MDFYPTAFTSIVTLDAPDTAKPTLKGDNFASKYMFTDYSQASLMKVKVQGKVGSDQCIVPLPNTTVRLTNTIKSGSGGHEHFSSNNELGTGSYSVITNTGVVDPDMLDTKGTVIEGKTTASGKFYSTFLPGHFGVVEKIVLDVKRDTSPLYPDENITPIEHELHIKAPNLVEMSDANDGGEFIFRYKETCKHNPTARWVVPGMRERLLKLDAAYKAKFGHRLSFNDASLLFGGTFDSKNNTGRDSLCHESHRRGNDIDVNSKDEKEENIRTTIYVDEGSSQSYARLRFVTDIAAKLDLEKVVEGPIHYRYMNY